MALSQATLKAEILKIIDEEDDNFVGWPATREIACTNWGNAYDSYIWTLGEPLSNARDVTGDSLISANKAAFIAALVSDLPGEIGNATDAADAFSKAFEAFWTGATFVSLPASAVPVHNAPCANYYTGTVGTYIFAPGSKAASAVTTIVTATIKSNLITEFGILSDDVDAKANSLANIFHTATTTNITITIAGVDTTPPTAGPYPIFNDCFIF